MEWMYWLLALAILVFLAAAWRLTVKYATTEALDEAATKTADVWEAVKLIAHDLGAEVETEEEGDDFIVTEGDGPKEHIPALRRIANLVNRIPILTAHTDDAYDRAAKAETDVAILRNEVIDNITLINRKIEALAAHANVTLVENGDKVYARRKGGGIGISGNTGTGGYAIKATNGSSTGNGIKAATASNKPATKRKGGKK